MLCHALYEITASIAMELQGAYLRNGSIVIYNRLGRLCHREVLAPTL